MRRPWPMLALAVLLGATACENPSGVSRDLSVNGRWTTSPVDSLTIEMTLSETARAVEGAGSWLTDTRVVAFRVTGAHVGSRVSLHFDFGDEPDVAFNGLFQETSSDTALLTGSLAGGPYRRTPIVLLRDDPDD